MGKSLSSLKKQCPVDSHLNSEFIRSSTSEYIRGSPDGNYQQVRESDGNHTEGRLDKGGHWGQPDPAAQGPHGHVPGVTDPNGNPHLPVYSGDE